MAVHAVIFAEMSLVSTTQAEIKVETFTRKSKVKLCGERSSGKFWLMKKKKKNKEKKKKKKRRERIIFSIEFKIFYN